MGRHINLSRLKSQMRQVEQKYRRDVNKAIRDYNAEVRRYNAQVKKSVDLYNKLVREHNSTVRKNKRIITREMGRLRTTSHTTYTISIKTMERHYADVAAAYPVGCPVTPEQDEILDLIESEQANSIVTANTIESDVSPEENTEDREIGDKLRRVSEDLDNRWKGAVFSLNPDNPDATRHFCTSAREIFTQFIEMKAPDSEVFQYNPNCKTTRQGNPTRQEKIRYMMRDKEMDSCVIEFADADIDNILQLFHVLSDGTHGMAGKYSFAKLRQVKKRVEQGINFLCTISE